MSTIRGGGTLSFAVNTSTFTVSGYTQSKDFSSKSEIEMVKNAAGDTANVITYDFYKEMQFTSIPTAVQSLPTIGAFAAVTDATWTEHASAYWIVKDANWKGTNTSVPRMEVSLVLYPNITT